MVGFVMTSIKAMSSLSLIINKNSSYSKTFVEACTLSCHVYTLFNKKLR